MERYIVVMLELKSELVVGILNDVARILKEFQDVILLELLKKFLS